MTERGERGEGGVDPDELTLAEEAEDGPIELAERVGWRVRLARAIARLTPHPKNPVAVFARAVARLLERDMSLVAAGMSFFTMLALFPAVVFATTLFGLLLSGDEVRHQFEGLTALIPAGARSLIGGQIAQLASRSTGSLTVQGFIALVLALWSSSRGLKGLVAGLNVLQGQRTHRGFFTFHLFGVVITGVAFGFALLISFVTSLLPEVLANLGVEMGAPVLGPLSRWGPTAVALWLMLTIVYRYGMAVEERMAWRWSATGAILGLAIWLVATIVFSEYIRFATFYNQLYGSLTALVVFILWLYVSSYAILMGGALVAILHETYGRPGARKS
ncbi:MAG: YihY/virulence factor BrkB family protein [Alphaproteobacteria bacterium]|nr:YihY/virulence factor BrkB family protein [Alphaproteobacteria bacterium]